MCDAFEQEQLAGISGSILYQPQHDPVVEDSMSFPEDAHTIATTEARQSSSVPASGPVDKFVNGQIRLRKYIHTTPRFKRICLSRGRRSKDVAMIRLKLAALFNPGATFPTGSDAYGYVVGEQIDFTQERDDLLKVRDDLLRERDAFHEQRSNLIQERDFLLKERDVLLQQRDGLLKKRNGYLGKLRKFESYCKDLSETNQSYAIALGRLRANMFEVFDDVERIPAFMAFIETFSTAGEFGRSASDISTELE